VVVTDTTSRQKKKPLGEKLKKTPFQWIVGTKKKGARSGVGCSCRPLRTI